MNEHPSLINSEEWKHDSRHWRGKVLTGKYSHWCDNWDGLPTDETCFEFSSCTCFPVDEEIRHLKELIGG